MTIETRLTSLPTRRRPPGAEDGPDLDTPEQIAEMVRTFYATVSDDDLLGPVFNDVARVDWDLHLPKLAAFWNRALLGIEGYQGNPFRVHASVNARKPFRQEHFDRWLELFRANLARRWSGPNVERALALADRVAEVHAGQLVAAADSEHPPHA